MAEATPSYSARASEHEGFETWTLSSGEAGVEATFAPKAGIVGCSLRHQGEELLDLGTGLAEYARTGALIGIPLLYPWANRLDGFEHHVEGRTVSLDRQSSLVHLDENGLPIHGRLAGSPHWEVRNAGADRRGAQLSAELDFGAHEDLLRAFPFPHLVRTDVQLRGADLTIRTIITATGGVPVPISFGYHPYLRLPGAPRENWQIELPVGRRLILDERMIPTGGTERVSFPREPIGDRSFDDGFADVLPKKPFVAAAGGRTLAVTFLERYPFAQLYSPPSANFICFEPMTAPTNALAGRTAFLPRVEPSGSFAAAFQISVRST